MKRYIKSSTQEYPDTFAVGDRIIIPLEGMRTKTATCVQVSGRGNNQYMFVFDSIVGESTMTNMDNFLDSLYDKFPESLSDRLNWIRLLQASEVFSDCDRPDSWDAMVYWGAKMQNPQIDYFKSRTNRISKGKHWWWVSDYLPILSKRLGTICYGYVNMGGSADSASASASLGVSLGVRPAFIIS